ncbi:hypothetical protein GLOIN_2v1867204 [Rhizophagus irregularis DAOM 181602=DAOM 197198]|uniref:Uncharacterized protein n=1 Tax=Rhizophagus irregularis (strain DAOM 181602 / DAOM 197198 / MUCL 43194) TaxID=747089 RepID=U9TAC8_RHIID|nr:hypothetical protein GLOIN_2v1867204 [Rhizophagus irregularis DAOM 181602=DAOM 197198]POG82900.1 hypothetical protein GLOIN_2v1867204 [Rhizophagus irregularis DAOM 181602=DAOM 197198]CAG8439830.1 16464_t:CDS:2 [Rhizophagus irregularis]|eukprot:XP_025189766.1 hypothetical protein GLOIN_2v1867204 [Rhizophagus irregularis DAOM 181602=DAOM 197198]
MATHTTARKQPNYLAMTFTICFVCFIILIQFPLIFITPILEYKKIILFKEYNLPINENVEYSVATSLWIIVPIVYTYKTIGELGDVPIFCPSNYKYSFPRLQFICQIRISNIICMWLMFISTILATFAMHIPESKYNEWFGFGIEDNDSEKSEKVDKESKNIKK